MLQRVGLGLLLSVVYMVIASLVERKHLETALEYGLVDLPDATVPVSVFWLTPQYLLFGIVEEFTIVGLGEFFYDQVPSDLRSIGMSLYLSIFGVGSFLSSFLICHSESHKWRGSSWLVCRQLESGTFGLLLLVSCCTLHVSIHCLHVFC